MRAGRTTAVLALGGVLAAGTTGCTSPADREPVDADPTRGTAAPRPGSTTSSSPDHTGTGADPLAAAASGEARPPVSPRQAAAQIRAAERAIADSSTSGRMLVVAARTQQLAYRELVDRPRWHDRVLASLPHRLRRVARDNAAARAALRSMYPASPADLADEMPAWRIVAPPPARRLRSIYQQAERRYGVGWEYLAAINMVETAFGRVEGTSVAGAQGPMQFIPTTWEIYGGGGDIQDPGDSIMAAARLLRANGFAADPGAALHHYNDHDAYVRGVTLLAGVMERRPRAFLGYHAWQVYYLTSRGSIWLPEGYAEHEPVPVREWLRRHPVPVED